MSGLARNNDDETVFNNLIYTEYKEFVYPKFVRYLDFELRLATYGCRHASFCGTGHDVGENIGIYTLNTALFSFGGTRGPDGHPINDEKLLRIETRRLCKWLQETDFVYKILVMHHPMNHLIGWAEAQLGQIISRSFDLVLQGHVHMPNARYVDTGITRTVICTAPPLFTRKNEILGYTVIDVSPSSGSIELRYRQSSQALKFVAGSFFTGTDDGILKFGSNTEPERYRQPGAQEHS